jgi:hypothetical protein
VKWKRESGYHQQSKAENSFYRYKTIFGDRMRARHPDAQQTEARIATNALIKLSAIGMPKSDRIRAKLDKVLRGTLRFYRLVQQRP